MTFKEVIRLINMQFSGEISNDSSSSFDYLAPSATPPPPFPHATLLELESDQDLESLIQTTNSRGFLDAGDMTESLDMASGSQIITETNADSPSGSSEWLIPSPLSSSMEGSKGQIEPEESTVASTSTSRGYNPMGAAILKLCHKDPSQAAKHVFALNSKGKR